MYLPSSAKKDISISNAYERARER